MMDPGNDHALISQFEEYAQRSHLTFTVRGEEVELYHPQLQNYPYKLVAEALYDAIEETGYDLSIPLEDVPFTSDHAEEEFDDTCGLNDVINRMDELLVERGLNTGEGGLGKDQFYDTRNLESTTIDIHQQADHLPQWNTIGEMVSVMLTMGHTYEAAMNLTSFTDPAFNEGDRQQRKEAASALRHHILNTHGWCLFDVPDPSDELLKEVWTIGQEMDDFNITTEWAYSLFVTATDSRSYEPDDSTDRSLKTTMGDMMMGRHGYDYEKWEAEDEPPIETIRETPGENADADD